MKIVTDCNVIIAAGLTNGTARRALMEVLNNHENFLSDDIIREYRDVIKRPKFNLYHDALKEILESVCHCSNWISYPPPRSKFELPDKFDHIYIDLAVEVKADFLITGNMKDFPQKSYNNTKILSPKEFLNKVEAELC